jgi:poly(hydroxyalkanoate) granule-associated protein
MVKKISKSAATESKGSAKGVAGAAAAALGGLNTNKLAASVRDSAQQIWLAGMGAFAKAQEEGGKVFETLVKEGVSLQKKTQGLAEDKIAEVTGKMSAMAETVTSKAGQNWDKLETIFEQRTAKAMSKLGVPTAKDVQALTARVDELAAAVAKLSKATGVATKASSRPRARKAAAR